MQPFSSPAGPDAAELEEWIVKSHRAGWGYGRIAAATGQHRTQVARIVARNRFTQHIVTAPAQYVAACARGPFRAETPKPRP